MRYSILESIVGGAVKGFMDSDSGRRIVDRVDAAMSGDTSKLQEDDEVGESCHILGVDRSDSIEEIKKKYLELSKKYHPDNKRTGSNEKMKDINWAYGIMSQFKGER